MKVDMKEHQSLQIFKNPFFERFTFVHPILPLLLWGPIVVGLVWRSFAVHSLNAYEVFGVGLSAFLFWTLAEYLLHRYLFHFEPHGKMQERFLFIVHGNHHDDPNDPYRLVMPPFVSIVLALIFFSLFKYVMGPVYVEPFFAFFILGYLTYDYTHFAIHHFTPHTRVGRWIKNHHMQHHYVNPLSRWGVSSPLWDYVFGTVEGVNRVRHGS